MKDLYDDYKAWRKQMAEANEGLDENIQEGSTDCGEATVREDFSEFAGLDKTIEFKAMQELEEKYESEE